MAPTLSVDLTLRSRIRISKVLMMIYFVQGMLGVLVVVLGYHVMKSMALFNDVVRDAYSHEYYPSLVVVCGVYTSFVNLCGIQVCQSFYPNVTTLRLGLCYRKSVCLSVWNVRAVHPIQEVELFGNISSALCTLAIL